jgi:hypothetical protein
MYLKSSFPRLSHAIRLIATEIRQLRSTGPNFLIIHRFRMPGTGCLPGEEIFAVYLVQHGRHYHLPLSASLRLLFDYLARHPRAPQSARQIELGILSDDFYAQHGDNSGQRGKVPRRISRTAVREYIRRLHQALELAFEDAGLGIDPARVLIVEGTVGNEVGYQLRASCTWTHVDLTSAEAQPLV